MAKVTGCHFFINSFYTSLHSLPNTIDGPHSEEQRAVLGSDLVSRLKTVESQDSKSFSHMEMGSGNKLSELDMDISSVLTGAEPGRFLPEDPAKPCPES